MFAPRKFALLLIDEVDASLHPKAQRRLVEKLLTLSREKGVQVILTTHSPYVLESLPADGRVLIQRTGEELSVIHGATPAFCLSTIDDRKHPEISVFCEDKRAAVVVGAIIAAATNPLNVETFPVGSYAVVKQLADLGSRGLLPYGSAGVIDGSQRGDKCVSLPGGAEPELVVFGGLKEKQWPEVENRFGIRYSEIAAILDEAMRAEDPHEWLMFVGDKLRRSGDVVWDTLVTLWVQVCLEKSEIDEFCAAVRERSLIGQGSSSRSRRS